MTSRTQTALAATQSIRRSPGYASLPAGERATLDRDLARIEATLRGGGRRRPTYGQRDPYAVPLETPNDLRTAGRSGPSPRRRTNDARPAPAPPPSRPATQPGTEVIGDRARRALDAVDFPSFVAGLIQGTFQAIVDATTQQVREYAQLVADLSKSVDEFTRDNVSDNQARDWLVERHPRDLTLVLPEPGSHAEPELAPRTDDASELGPEWLDGYGLAGERLTAELAEGPLLRAGRRALGEQRMQHLATLVLMGINRIVVDDGQLKAKLQFHARAREKTSAEVLARTGAQQQGIAGRQSSATTAVSTMVSTVDVNTQSEVAIKTDLVGEISVRFRTETFNLERFADSNAIALINRHALTRQAATPASEPTAPNETTGDGEESA